MAQRAVSLVLYLLQRVFSSKKVFFLKTLNIRTPRAIRGQEKAHIMLDSVCNARKGAGWVWGGVENDKYAYFSGVSH